MAKQKNAADLVEIVGNILEFKPDDNQDEDSDSEDGDGSGDDSGAPADSDMADRSDPLHSDDDSGNDSGSGKHDDKGEPDEGNELMAEKAIRLDSSGSPLQLEQLYLYCLAVCVSVSHRQIKAL